MQASKRFFKSYARFSGRASLSEYWWAQLMIAILMLPFLALYIAGFVVVSLQASSYAYEYGTTGYSAPGTLLGGGALALVGALGTSHVHLPLGQLGDEGRGSRTGVSRGVRKAKPRRP